MRIVLLLIALLLLIMTLLSSIGNAQSLPDGTLVMSNKPGTLVGNIARRLANGDEHTHVGIVFRGRVYHMDFPYATSVPVAKYGKRGEVIDYYVPTSPVQEAGKMLAAARSMMGQPYSLRGFMRPHRKPGTWCSPFVGKVLNAGGYHIPPSVYHKPQTLLNYMRSQVRFSHRVTH